MKKIVCPTDFSEAARNAIAYAAKVAQVAQAELVLLNVHSLFSLTPVELVSGHSDTVSEIQKQLEAEAKEVARQFKISCYSEVQVSGFPLSSIISAEAQQFDLIVMGTNGPDDLYQFFLGTNTYHVIQKSTTPVLLVPVKYTFSPIDTVVYAFDYWREGNLPLTPLLPWLQYFKSELRIVEVLEASRSEVQDEEMRGRQEILRHQIDADIPVSFDAIYTQDPKLSLHQYMARNQADMLALHVHPYSWLEKLFHKSLTKSLSMIADYPMFVFHG